MTEVLVTGRLDTRVSEPQKTSLGTTMPPTPAAERQFPAGTRCRRAAQSDGDFHDKKRNGTKQRGSISHAAFPSRRRLDLHFSAREDFQACDGGVTAKTFRLGRDRNAQAQLQKINTETGKGEKTTHKTPNKTPSMRKPSHRSGRPPDNDRWRL